MMTGAGGKIILRVTFQATMKYQARVLNISDQTDGRKNYILDVDLINFFPKK